MAESNVIASVDTTGYSYNNALAKTVNRLFKSEVIKYLKQSWNGVNYVELATLAWVVLLTDLVGLRFAII